MERLVTGFAEVASQVGPRRSDTPEAIADLLALHTETVLTPREAFFAAQEANVGTVRCRPHCRAASAAEGQARRQLMAPVGAEAP